MGLLDFFRKPKPEAEPMTEDPTQDAFATDPAVDPILDLNLPVDTAEPVAAPVAVPLPAPEPAGDIVAVPLPTAPPAPVVVNIDVTAPDLDAPVAQAMPTLDRIKAIVAGAHDAKQAAQNVQPILDAKAECELQLADTQQKLSQESLARARDAADAAEMRAIRAYLGITTA